jgi:uncharacterized repeat protein (TIGR03803 family)
MQNGKFKLEKEENPMKANRSVRTLGVLRRKVVGYGCFGVLRRGVLGSGRWSAVLIIAIATLASASGAPADTCKAIHVFTSTAGGAKPVGNLTFDAAGNLYGTTFVGGSGCRCGVVWKLAPNPDGTWSESVLHTFTGGEDGANPLAGLIFDAAGNLYGTTGEGGGVQDRGTVFKLAPNPDGTWTENVLHRFAYTDGANPVAGLIFDPTGNLYGTTYYSSGFGGTVFKLTPNPDGTWTESVLYFFSPGADGSFPAAGLILDAAGNLYGTTVKGYISGDGVVFKLAPNPDGTWTYSVLHSFTGADGSGPGAVVFDASGNLYGTTLFGGSKACNFGLGCGVVFKLTPTSSGWRETVLHTFMGFGRYPNAVILDSAGHLFGTTSSGKEGNYGLVYEITP